VNTAMDENTILAEALKIAEKRLTYKTSERINCPNSLREFVKIKFGSIDTAREHFVLIFMNARHKVLGCEVLHSGETDGCQVSPKEVVKACMRTDACVAVILAHNHPSGNQEPSAADIGLTSRLKNALSLVDIRVLDHMIVAADTCTSFAERGLL
jgi:DNA repair protein RadC